MSSIKPPLPDLSTADDTEQRFYEALQSGDIDRLMALWSDEEEVSCVQPGGARVVGLRAVRESFEQMFAQGPVDAHPEQVRRLVHHDCAIHSVLERVGVTTEKGPGSAWILSTNVYMKTAMGWKLVSHHASPGLLGPPPMDNPATLH
jgi:ketosteroid isomerase-like protein